MFGCKAKLLKSQTKTTLQKWRGRILAVRGVKTRNSNQWTEARYISFVKSALRKAQWGVKYECIKRAFVKYGINKTTNRKVKLYRCCHCKNLFMQKEMKADHISPVVDPKIGFVDWNTFINRLFVEIDGFQALCKSCHDKKTNEEKKIAKNRNK